MNVLIEAAELSAELDRDTPLVVADVRWALGAPSRRPEYLNGHIPGARFVDLEADLSDSGGTGGGRHPLPDPADFQQAMRRIGVSNDRPVVIYDDAGSLAAARLWWMLRDAGKNDVAVLNGGYRAWIDGGYPTEAGQEPPAESGDFDARPGQLPTIDGDRLAAQVHSGQAPTIIDVRAAERYAGSVEPMDPAAGHVPGAINLPSMSNVGADGRFRDPADIAARYDNATGDDQPVVYCGSGITAAHTILSRAVAGLPPAVLYPGSWSDWVTDPQRPVATGDQP